MEREQGETLLEYVYGEASQVHKRSWVYDQLL